MEQAGRAAREEECRHEMAAWQPGRLRYGGMEHGVPGCAVAACLRKTCPGCTAVECLLRQGQAGIAVQHMKMALFDEGGVGGGQDIEIIDAGERKALDGSPVSLAVAGAVVI